MEKALAAEPQPLTGLEEASATAVTPPKEEPAPEQADGKTASDSSEDKRLAYAKALVACGGTPEGIQTTLLTLPKKKWQKPTPSIPRR